MIKLINFFECPHFNLLRNEMEAPLTKNFNLENEIKLLDENLIRKLGQEGIDLPLDKIELQEDKTLSYQGQRVLVYIRDVTNYKNNPDPFPKFHLAYCRTLAKMQQNDRWQRYVLSNREDGYFQINLNSNGWKSSMEKLSVCQNCLLTLKWENFSSDSNRKKEIVSNFSLDQFFKLYPKSLISVKPQYTSDIAPLNDYTEDWAFVSENIKKRRNYTCESCHLFLGNDKKYLHTHHKDGQKFNNRESNLEVLCFRCHADEHPHMKTFEYERFRNKYG